MNECFASKFHWMLWKSISFLVLLKIFFYSAGNFSPAGIYIFYWRKVPNPTVDRSAWLQISDTWRIKAAIRVQSYRLHHKPLASEFSTRVHHHKGSVILVWLNWSLTDHFLKTTAKILQQGILWCWPKLSKGPFRLWVNLEKGQPSFPRQ